MSIKLYTETSGGLHEEFKDSNLDLKAEATFKRAVVTAGTWIFHTYKNYNDGQGGGTPSQHKILKPGADEDIASVNGSMYLVKDDTEGVIVFDHYYYGGKRQWFEESCADLSTVFGKDSGASSMIVLSTNESFAIFKKINYEGLENILPPGKWCETSDAMGFPNDEMRSFRKV